MNRFIACGDLHAEINKPQYRKDNYWETWQNKMLWIIHEANRRKARLLIAGDLFNTSRVKPDVTNTVLAIFNEADFTPYVVAGQHDLKYHTDIEKTPIFTLALAGAVRIVQGSYGIFTGAGFEEPIPSNENTFLITHTCITPRRPPFFLEDAVSAKKFMRDYPNYEIIISGDYHVPFQVTVDNRHLINCGTIIRNKKDMVKYTPYVWYIDIENGIDITKLEVPHKPYEEVFDTEAISYDESHGITIDTSKLKELIDMGIEGTEWKNVVWNVHNTMQKEGMTFNKELIQEVLDECS